MLYCGERIGCTSEPRTDIAVDPLDGTTLVSQGRNGAIAVIAVAERGALFDPGPCMYMEKVHAGVCLCDSWLHAEIDDMNVAADRGHRCCSWQSGLL